MFLGWPYSRLNGCDAAGCIARRGQGGAQLQSESKFFGETARITIAGHDLRLLIPTTFMNRSGKAVAAMAGFYKIAPGEMLIAHDELDIPAGSARFRFGGVISRIQEAMSAIGNPTTRIASVNCPAASGSGKGK